MTERTRHHRVRRMALRVVVFLLLGAMVNVAVAWGCAIYLPDERDDWHSRVGALRFDDGNVWGVWRLSRAGYSRIQSHVGGPPPDWDPRWEDPHLIIESWSLVPTEDDDGLEWDEEMSGWPTHCLWSRLFQLDAARSFGGPSARVLPRDVVENGVVIDSSLLPARSILPTGTIWPGFAINTLFYAAILWLLFAAPGRVRRWQRIKHGLCPKCAYPQGASEVCTECGEIMIHRRVAEVAE